MRAIRSWLLASGLVVTAAHAVDGVGAVPSATPQPARPTAAVGFNEQDFELAYQAFLADARLSQALRLARQAVQARPADPTWRRRLAQCEPTDALRERWEGAGLGGMGREGA